MFKIRQNLSRLGALTLLSAAAFCPALRADVAPAKIFTSGMVLQRGKTVPVWGTAFPGEPVTVQFAGQTKKTAADKAGKWEVRLDPMKPDAEGRTLTIDGFNSVTLRDVLVGDVWLCTGQSNMEMPFAWGVATGEETIAEAKKYPQIRHFKVEFWSSTAPWTELRMIYPTNEHTYPGQWRACTTPEVLDGVTVTGYYFARKLVRETGVPVGILESNLSGTPIEIWMAPDSFKGVKGLEKWAEKVASYDPKKPSEEILDAGTSYMAMFSPIERFPVAGAIWYQGENNERDGLDYEAKQIALVSGWRKAWKDNFPFYFVQLASFRPQTDDPQGGNGYAFLREAQRRALSKIPKAGMAVTIDIGDAKDIHPKNKVDVGERLALWALRDIYGKSNVVPSGPLFRSMTVDNGRAVLSFDYAESGLTSGMKPGLEPMKETKEPLRGFAVAGPDGKYYHAQAVIDGDKVIVSAPEVTKPVAVRYAFRANPMGRANLYNRAGLPASPFFATLPGFETLPAK